MEELQGVDCQCLARDDLLRRREGEEGVEELQGADCQCLAGDDLLRRREGEEGVEELQGVGGSWKCCRV